MVFFGQIFPKKRKKTNFVWILKEIVIFVNLKEIEQAPGPVSYLEGLEF